MAGGRSGGRALPRGRAAAVGTPGQIRRGREPAGRGLGDRDGRRRQSRARWLHHRDGRQRIARDQRHHVQEAAVRSGQGFHPDHARRPDPVRPRGDAVLAGAFGDRARGLCQGQSRQAVVRIGRARIAPPSLRRAAQEHDRHRDDARSLQGQRARAHRRDRRPCAVAVLGHGAVAAADQGRKSACARRVHRGPPAVCARDPADCRSRRSRLRCRRLGRVLGAGRYAEGSREQAASRAHQRPRIARRAAADHQARHDPGRALLARGAAAFHQRRDRALGQGRAAGGLGRDGVAARQAAFVSRTSERQRATDLGFTRDRHS